MIKLFICVHLLLQFFLGINYAKNKRTGFESTVIYIKLIEISLCKIYVVWYFVQTDKNKPSHNINNKLNKQWNTFCCLYIGMYKVNNLALSK